MKVFLCVSYLILSWEKEKNLPFDQKYICRKLKYFVLFAEFVEINDQMDQISSFLDDLEQKNDNLQVRKLLHSFRENSSILLV